MGTPDLQPVGQKYNGPDFPLVSEAGAVLWDWALSLWDLTLTPGRQCQNLIELQDTQLV